MGVVISASVACVHVSRKSFVSLKELRFNDECLVCSEEYI